MDWSTIWQTVLPLLVYVLGQVVVFLKTKQAAGHAQSAANHSALNNAAIQQQSERLSALEQRVMKR